MGDVERSKLLNKHIQERKELEKDVKKKKGALKEQAQAKLDELIVQQEAELKKLDAEHGTGKPKKEEEEEPNEKQVLIIGTDVKERNWNSLSNKEAQDECAKRGLSSKGKKEQLLTRLIVFHSELEAKLADGSIKIEDKKPEPEEEDSEESSSDDEEDDDEDDEKKELTPEELEEAEKQYKREKIVRKAIKHLLTTKHKEGFQLDALPELLEGIKVKNFTPAMCGYKSMEDFAKKQPERLFRYSKSKKLIRPPKGGYGGDAD
jgi:hypothetical protein